METIKKLKSALLDINVLNTSLVKKNNSLQIELSFMPEEMREKSEECHFSARIRGRILIISSQMGTDSFSNQRIRTIQTSPSYDHVAITILLVTSLRRQMTSCASSIPATRKAMSIKKVIITVVT
jgi:hypothetical protein